MSDERPAAVSGATAGLKTLVDDTVRIQIDIEPRFAQDAMRLFGTRGTTVALAVMRTIEGETVVEPEAAEPEAPYSRHAQTLYRSDFFRRPQVWEAVGTDEDFLAWLRAQACAFSEFGPCSGDVVAAHVRRVANGAGVGVKPLYSAVPACHDHHALQHQGGESELGGKAHWDRLRIQYLHRWCWETVKTQLGYGSWTEVPPAVLLEWARWHGVEKFLPEGYCHGDT